MGDVRKTPTPAKRAGTASTVDFDPAKFKSLVAQLQDEIAKLDDAADAIKPGKVKVGGGVLEAAKALETVRGDVEAWRERFKPLMLDHYKAGGAFLTGKVLIAFPSSLTRRPAWKGIAVTLASELAALKKQTFDEKEYEKGVLEATPQTEAVSMQLTEVQ